jgi:hypothetical protein
MFFPQLKKHNMPPYNIPKMKLERMSGWEMLETFVYLLFLFPVMVVAAILYDSYKKYFGNLRFKK